MASRADFTDAEWQVLATAPEAVGLAVLAADPVGAVEERTAMFEAWRQSAEQPFADNQLVLTLIRNRDTWGEEMRLRTSREEALSSLPADETQAWAIEQCRQAMALLEAKGSPDDRESYRQWVIYLAENVAEAVGGKSGRVDPAERAVIDAVATALDLKP
ncbi:MAG: hypothetical protein RMN52_09970 [Anaerolineae bacterium]|nr:hypothetical protein [Candidatus Roseilinea sp.]MDW8450320.1 hypothetical protein [Anaerolineae bacterium]